MTENSDRHTPPGVQHTPDEQDSAKEHLKKANHTSLVCIALADDGLEEAGTLLKAWVPDVPLSIIVVPSKESQVSFLKEQLASLKTFTLSILSETTTINPGHIYVLSPQRPFTFQPASIIAGEAGKAEKIPGEAFLTSFGRTLKQRALLLFFSEVLADYNSTIKLLSSCQASIIHHSQKNSAHSRHEEGPTHHLVDRSSSLEEVAVYTQRFIESFTSTSIAELEKNQQSLSYIQHVTSILADQIGHTFSHINPSYVLIHVFQRLRLLGLTTIHEYIEKLASDRDEVERLARRISLRNTFFFNDLRSLRVIAKMVIPSLLKEAKPDQVIRVWVPGCGSGEDVLSLSMLIHEHADSPQNSTKIRLLGTENDDHILKFARSPRYSPDGLSKIPDILKDKFFTRDADHYEYNATYLDQCHFSPLHPTTAGPYTNVDIIYCKDVLPILTQSARKTLLEHFKEALSPKGILVIGSNEVGHIELPMFAQVGSQPFIFKPVPDAEEEPAKSHSINLFREQADAAKTPRKTPTSPQAQQDQVRRDQAQPNQNGQEKSAQENNVHTLHKDLLLQIQAPVSLMIRPDFTIVDHIGNVGRFIAWPSNGHTVNMLEAFPKGVQEDLRFAVNQVLKSKIALKSRPIRTEYEGIFREFRLQVHPINLDEGANNLIQVIFLETDISTAKHTPAPAPTPRPTEDQQSVELLKLTSELNETKEKLGIVSGLLKESKELLKKAKEKEQQAAEQAAKENSANEYQKLLRQNEELRSTNTELLELNRDLVRRIEELRKSMNRKMKEVEQANATQKVEKTDTATPAPLPKGIELILPKRHELRTALTSIIGFADLLADRMVDKDNRELAKYIGKSGHRLSEFLSPMLNMEVDDAETELQTAEEEQEIADDIVSSDRVLVVEDSEATRRLLTLVLSDRFDCEVASDGSEAIKKAEKEIFKAVLLDIDLGKGPNGIDVLDHLRQKNYYRTVPFMAVTSMATPQDRSMLLRKGFDAFVPKPFQKGLLLSTLDKIIDGSGIIA